MANDLIDFAAQVAAVERAAINHSGHVQNLVGLVKAKKRPEHELQIARSWLPALIEAAKTMREIARRKQLQKEAEL